ncbi:MAG: hypothetical protein K2Z80_24825 [Xanthobacteraceae bacterium]|nr:hypothetical protein [Xanthobacteraceae bacterium]
MSARWPLALVLLVSCAAPGGAQSRIPSSELPGREWQRFTDSPFERYRKPQAQIKLQSADPLPPSLPRSIPPRGKKRK